MVLLLVLGVLLFGCGGGGGETPTSPSPEKRAEVVQIVGISNVVPTIKCGDTIRGRQRVEIKFVYSASETVTASAVAAGAAYFSQGNMKINLPPGDKKTGYFVIACPVGNDGNDVCSLQASRELVTTTLGIRINSAAGEFLDQKEMPCTLTWLPDP